MKTHVPSHRRYQGCQCRWVQVYVRSAKRRTVASVTTTLARTKRPCNIYTQGHWKKKKKKTHCNVNHSVVLCWECACRRSGNWLKRRGWLFISGFVCFSELPTTGLRHGRVLYLTTITCIVEINDRIILRVRLLYIYIVIFLFGSNKLTLTIIPANRTYHTPVTQKIVHPLFGSTNPTLTAIVCFFASE